MFARDLRNGKEVGWNARFENLARFDGLVHEGGAAARVLDPAHDYRIASALGRRRDERIGVLPPLMIALQVEAQMSARAERRNLAAVGHFELESLEERRERLDRANSQI